MIYGGVKVSAKTRSAAPCPNRSEQRADRGIFSSARRNCFAEAALHDAAAEIGHWVSRLERDPLSHAEVWEFRCQLCRYKFRYKLGTGVDYVLPLTGNLSKRRRRHDRSKHPETVREQARAEHAAIGRNARPPGVIRDRHRIGGTLGEEDRRRWTTRSVQ